ncbi:GNAT family N-acetyltransferase [Lujinxingia litoralis]|uniref:GNAT family N-acetyltransferase n=1 Tax=Lujinxingia litoralis TaxID=2211119 RepID=A0A328C5B4_9DELT|nr:GNAT family N-acetyltransferase [Lujinxingia litoralis]RAL21775.1 GNAT family N-acetyltransferase [Lujinxingia litoralis]
MSQEAGPVEVRRLSGESVHRYIDDLARLRIEIFRTYPYLYDGDLDYERRYLARYLESAESVLVAAFDGERVVGVSTGMPMAASDEDFQRPFNELGYDVDAIFYLAESVLLPEYRGQGVGVRFFEEREAHVRDLGRFRFACFAAVVRPPDHPDRPEGWQPLDDFWRRRGYERQPQIRTMMRWKEIATVEEVPEVMEIWLKDLDDG